METERFEALIDAILAIIITIIVLEIPLASNGSWQALLDIKYEFIIYAISFMICFNFWNFNNNIFSIVNKIDPKVIWTMGLTLFVFSLLPYLTTFVAENFYVFFPQFMYGLIFIITAILSMIIGRFLKDADPKRALPDSKTALQEYAQAHSMGEICYRLIKAEGPDHERVFTMEAVIGGVTYAGGSGRSKKAAEQQDY